MRESEPDGRPFPARDRAGFHGRNRRARRRGPSTLYWIVGALMVVAGLYAVANDRPVGWFLVGIVVARVMVFKATGK